MKVHLVLDVGDYERFVIARYFAVAAIEKRDRKRRRATRAQVKRFVSAALKTHVKEVARELRPRSRAAATRLATPSPETPEVIAPPKELQQNLSW